MNKQDASLINMCISKCAQAEYNRAKHTEQKELKNTFQFW